MTDLGNQRDAKRTGDIEIARALFTWLKQVGAFKPNERYEEACTAIERVLDPAAASQIRDKKNRDYIYACITLAEALFDLHKNNESLELTNDRAKKILDKLNKNYPIPVERVHRFASSLLNLNEEDKQTPQLKEESNAVASPTGDEEPSESNQREAADSDVPQPAASTKAADLKERDINKSKSTLDNFRPEPRRSFVPALINSVTWYAWVLAMIVLLPLSGFGAFQIFGMLTGGGMTVEIGSPCENCQVKQLDVISGKVSEDVTVLRIIIHPENGGPYYVKSIPHIREDGRYSVGENFGDGAPSNIGANENYLIFLLGGGPENVVLPALQPGDELKELPIGRNIVMDSRRVFRPE